MHDLCGGTGYRSLVRDNVRYEEDCECKQAKVAEKRLAAVGIPERYEHYTLESFEFGLRPGGEDAILLQAQYMAWKIVENHPVETGGCGLLFTGSIGVGKTDLRLASFDRCSLSVSLVACSVITETFESGQEFLQSAGGDNRVEILRRPSIVKCWFSMNLALPCLQNGFGTRSRMY